MAITIIICHLNQKDWKLIWFPVYVPFHVGKIFCLTKAWNLLWVLRHEARRPDAKGPECGPSGSSGPGFHSFPVPSPFASSQGVTTRHDWWLKVVTRRSLFESTAFDMHWNVNECDAFPFFPIVCFPCPKLKVTCETHEIFPWLFPCFQLSFGAKHADARSLLEHAGLSRCPKRML